MRATFWGVRGSIACPGPSYARVGGNTSCVEIDVGGETIILDAGTGLRGLGESLHERRARSSTILLSHTHWDHTCGLPFFKPMYDPEHSVQIVAGHALASPGRIHGVLSAQITPPHFPLSLEEMHASVSFADLSPGTSFEIGRRVDVRTTALAHPGGATGFRIEHAGRALAYVTDTEHDPLRLDTKILALIDGADVVIYDSTYTDEEFDAHRGWGHSTWQEGVRLCRAAGAKRLAIFHHDPAHDDAFMRRLAHEAKRMWEGAFVAHEGLTIELATA
ncbi:MAG: MBL fold metallo-hydrolase [Labilithrix sp.]